MFSRSACGLAWKRRTATLPADGVSLPFPLRSLPQRSTFPFPRPSVHCDRAFTLIELLVVIVIIGILAAMLMPALGKAKARSHEAACLNQLKQWGTAFQLYADDNRGWLDDIEKWQSATYTDPLTGAPRINSYARYLTINGKPTAKVRRLRVCPAVAARMTAAQIDAGFEKSYALDHPDVFINGKWKKVPAINGRVFYSLANITHPSEFLLLVDANGTTTVTESGLKKKVLPILDRHGGGVNALWADQHVSFVTREIVVSQAQLPSGQRPWFQAY